jgi:hypothetical protein
MAKDILAFFGMLFLVLLIILGVATLTFFYDRIGIISLPEGIINIADNVPLSGTITVREVGIGKADWSNPLEAIPTATWTPAPTLTATPIPPLDPIVYEKETILRLKSFVSALERWLAANESITENSELLYDSDWLKEMQLSLEMIGDTGRAMADIGPPPPEYANIDQWIDRVAGEAEGLQTNYERALELHAAGNDSAKSFTAASDNFVRIKEYLFQAVEGMLTAGWTF